MATIVLSQKPKSVSAELSDLEYQIVAADIEANGTKGLESLFQSYLEQKYRVLVSNQVKEIKEFVETANDEKRAALLAVVKS